MTVSDIERYPSSPPLAVSPRHILCLKCLEGGGEPPFMDKYKLRDTAAAIKANPLIKLRLDCAFDETGARTELFYEQTPAERKADLDFLAALGLVPGSIRAAAWLFAQADARIPDITGICRRPDGSAGNWRECPLARAGHYKRGEKAYAFKRPDGEEAACKTSSCDEIHNADMLKIRAHHFMCMTCFAGRESYEPIAVDNLYEVIEKIIENPQIPVKLVEGAGECAVCPPCYGFDLNTGHCVAVCGLRDRKKDLDVFCLLGLEPGQVISGGEMFRRLYDSDAVPSVVCNLGSHAYEWTACGSSGGASYTLGRDFILSRLSPV